MSTRTVVCVTVWAVTVTVTVVVPRAGVFEKLTVMSGCSQAASTQPNTITISPTRTNRSRRPKKTLLPISHPFLPLPRFSIAGSDEAVRGVSWNTAVTWARNRNRHRLTTGAGFVASYPTAMRRRGLRATPRSESGGSPIAQVPTKR